MSTSPRETGPALEKMIRFVLWLIPTVEKFPRSQRFQPGDSRTVDVVSRPGGCFYIDARVAGAVPR